MVELPEEGVIAAQQGFPQVEQLHLLDALVRGQQFFQVTESPGLGSASGDDPEGEARVARLRNKCRHGSAEEDQRQPGAEAHQQRGQGEERDRVLHQKETVVDDTQRPHVGLTAGVLLLVVKGGILEEAQIQGQRLADDEGVDVIGELGVEQVLGQGAQLPDHRASEDEAKLHPQVGGHVSQSLDRR